MSARLGGGGTSGSMPRIAEEAGRLDEEGDDQPLDPQATSAALQRYAAFRERLQGDLRRCSQLRQALQTEQRAYADLSSNVALLQQESLGSLQTLVPLGADVQARAAVPDTSRIFVHVALGFHPELTLEEAQHAAALKRQHLQAHIDARTAEMASIRAHVRLVEQALADLQGLQAQAQAQA